MEEKQTSVNYQFTAVPTNLFYLLNNNCKSTLFTLIQASSYFAKEDGYFFLTKESLCDLAGLSVNVLTAALDTLYIHGIINITVGKIKGKYANHYKVNVESFKQYESLTFEELKDPSNQIEMVNYKNNYQPQYIKDYLKECKKVNDTNSECKEVCNDVCKEVCNDVCKEVCKKVMTNIDNKENINNKNNIIDIYTIDINKEENNIINNITKEEEIMEVVEERNMTPTVEVKKKTVKDVIPSLLNKLNDCISIDDLKSKVELLCDWYNRKNDGSIGEQEFLETVSNVYTEKLNNLKLDTVSTLDEQSTTNEEKVSEIEGKQPLTASNDDDITNVGMKLGQYKKMLSYVGSMEEGMIQSIRKFLIDNEKLINSTSGDLSKNRDYILERLKVIKSVVPAVSIGEC